MKKPILITTFCTLFVITFTLFFTTENKQETTRAPAASIPENYESLSACEKQAILWKKMEKTIYSKDELRGFKKLGIRQLLWLSWQELQHKGEHVSDFAPEGWEKYLHARGSIAKIKIVPLDGNSLTGVFQGAECGLLRLSLTYKPTPVAPGLALKILRDKAYSANISALVSLSGQDEDYNFFKNSMSNIVPVGTSFGEKRVHNIFKDFSSYPEELVVDDMAAINSQGEKINPIVTTRQLFFVPKFNNFSSQKHDVRDDFFSIPEGTVIYEIRAMPNNKDFDYTNKYTSEMKDAFLKESQPVANIITTSPFVSSEFGDSGIFFRHQLRP